MIVFENEEKLNLLIRGKNLNLPGKDVVLNFDLKRNNLTIIANSLTCQNISIRNIFLYENLKAYNVETRYLIANCVYVNKIYCSSNIRCYGDLTSCSTVESFNIQVNGKIKAKKIIYYNNFKCFDKENYLKKLNIKKNLKWKTGKKFLKMF